MLGKGPNVRIAVQPGFRRGFRFLLPAGEPQWSLRAVGSQAPVGCVERAARIRTETSGLTGKAVESFRTYRCVSARGYKHQT